LHANPDRDAHRRGVRALLIGTAAALGLAGCGGSAPTAGDDLPEKNIDQWVMPMDQYQVQWVDRIREEYATAQLDAKCMRAAGYDLEVPWRDLTGPVTRPHINAVGRVLFNRKLVEEFGYHQAPSPEETLGDWLAYSTKLNMIDAAEQAVLDNCIEATYKVLPPLDGEANRVAGIAETAWQAALEDDSVVKAAKDWRECMLPFGIPDLPGDPRQMPPDSLGVERNPSPTENPDVSPREISVAVGDFDCRVSSGFRVALYNAEWDRQVKLARENVDDLVRSQQQFAERRQRVEELLSLGQTD